MTKQAAAVIALGIAGAVITCLFAYMCLMTGRSIWGWGSLIMGASTVWGLMSVASSKSESDEKSPD